MQYSYAHQSIVSGLDGSVVAHELFLRDYNGCPISTFLNSPELFVNEIDGLIVCAAKAAKFIQLKYAVETVWVNFTPEQIAHPNFINSLESFYRQGISPSSIAIEVTEQHYANDVDLFYSNLKRAREIGHPIIIDDFGSGVSNFNYVHELRPSIVKTDMAILHAAEHDPFSLEFLQNLVSFLSSVQCRTVIEGIEHERHFQIASMCRGDYLQGYHFGKPSILTGNDITQFDLSVHLKNCVSELA
jgi:EAL domain-containing protein (putative c-di-GMP-specific phosphodiesterase class I)